MSENPAEDAPIRAFAAIVVDASKNLERFLQRLDGLGACVRPVRAQNLHITLKFYGDINGAKATELAQGFDEIAARIPPFEWTLCGTGAFPTIARPSVVWVGARDEGQLVQVANSVDHLSEQLGFARERRPFQPHVTVARIRCRPPDELKKHVERFAREEFGVQHATQLVLFRSSLERSGSMYERLHVSPFGGGSATR
jgi:2'-5' RNA ligase